MQKKLDLAYELLNAFMQWFLYHHLPLDDEIQAKIEKFYNYEVKNENQYV